jgi:sodium-coupled neutral amino acid transporter 11
MTNLFQGREAHEGDDHAVLDRRDRRWATTIALYLSALFPALYFDNVGIVLALTGTVAATTLTYIGPGILFIGVHGQEFLDLVESWGDSPGFFDRLLWYLIFMPFWCQIAKFGKKGLLLDQRKKESMTPANEYRLGSVRHKREMIRQHKQRRSRDNILGDDDVCQPESETLLNEADKTSAELGLITATAVKSISYGSVSNLSKGGEFQCEVVETDHEEEDPQDEKRTAADFAVAIIFVFIGAIAFTAGIISIYMK